MWRCFARDCNTLFLSECLFNYPAIDCFFFFLRSAGGMVTAVNELRNNNTVAHPNGNLTQKREAQLVIRLVNAIIDYVEDIERSISKSVSP